MNGLEVQKCIYARENIKKDILHFVRKQLDYKYSRDDYREILEWYFLYF